MTKDSLFMDFANNLSKELVSAGKTDLENKAASYSNKLAAKQGAEQQGYAAMNYAASLDEMQNANLDTAIQELQAEGQATVDSAVNGTNTDSAMLSIARAVGKSNTELATEQKYAAANYQNERKSIAVQTASSKQLTLSTPGLLPQLITAGTETYFDALKSGLIS